MARDSRRAGLLQGTLDLLILRTLLFGPLHGHGITKHIQRTSEDVLLVEHGSLYPALHRLEKNGWITSKWEQAEQGARDAPVSPDAQGPEAAHHRGIEVEAVGSSHGADAEAGVRPSCRKTATMNWHVRSIRV